MASTMNIGKYYYAEVVVKANFHIICNIDTKLNERPSCDRLWFKSCFRQFSNVSDTRQEPMLLHFMLSNLVEVNKDKEELIFEVAGQKLHFGPEQFSLISDLKFGVLPRIAGYGGGPFRKRVFGKYHRKTSHVTVKHLLGVYERLSEYNDMDVVRICLLLFLHVGCIDSNYDYVVDDELLRLVEDTDAWNNFPWGSYLWRLTYESLCDSRQQVTFYPKLPLQDPIYGLEGFMFVFKIWILEVLPCSRKFAKKNRIMRLPRCIAWSQNKDFGWLVSLKFDKMSMQEQYTPKDIQATPAEKNRPCYKETMRFLESPKEDVESLLAKFERRFNLMDKKNEERRFGNMEELLEVLWNKAFPNYDMHDNDIIDEELLQLLETQEANQQVMGTHELVNKADDEFTDENLLNCLRSIDDEENIPDNNVSLSPRVFERTAGQFYNRYFNIKQNAGTKFRRVDHYCVIKDFPYHLDTNFWGRLLTLVDNGWLLNEHIDVWSNMVALSPSKDQRCGILPVVFHKILEDCERIYELANGTEGPCSPWWTLDRVIFPLNQLNQHWMLAELDLRSWVVTFYDSMIHRAFDCIQRTSFFKEIVDKLEKLMPVFLHKLNYWEKAQVVRIDKLQINMRVEMDVPHQVDGKSCGIYVCHFIEKLAHGHPVHIQCDAKIFQESYREFLTNTIYSTRVE